MSMDSQESMHHFLEVHEIIHILRELTNFVRTVSALDHLLK